MPIVDRMLAHLFAIAWCVPLAIKLPSIVQLLDQVQEVTLGLAGLVTDHAPVDLLSETAFPVLTPPTRYA